MARRGEDDGDDVETEVDLSCVTSVRRCPFWPCLPEKTENSECFAPVFVAKLRGIDKCPDLNLEVLLMPRDDADACCPRRERGMENADPRCARASDRTKLASALFECIITVMVNAKCVS